VRDLGHPDMFVRLCAAQLVGEVGTAADCAPLIALLSDPKGEVGYSAVVALGKIGDDRTVIALDLWLRFHRVPGDPLREFAEAVKARDQIKARLAAQAKAKDAAKP